MDSCSLLCVRAETLHCRFSHLCKVSSPFCTTGGGGSLSLSHIDTHTHTRFSQFLSKAAFSSSHPLTVLSLSSLLLEHISNSISLPLMHSHYKCPSGGTDSAPLIPAPSSHPQSHHLLLAIIKSHNPNICACVCVCVAKCSKRFSPKSL